MAKAKGEATFQVVQAENPEKWIVRKGKEDVLIFDDKKVAESKAEELNEGNISTVVTSSTKKAKPDAPKKTTSKKSTSGKTAAKKKS